MESNNINVANRLFWVSIIVREGKYPSCKVKDHFYWILPWHVRIKWSWYFKYRAALAQVQNPHYLVDFSWGNKEPDLRTRTDFIKQSIITKRRMITKLSNELEKHKTWLLANHLFGLDGDDGRIPRAISKISKYKLELTNLSLELEELATNNL